MANNNIDIEQIDSLVCDIMVALDSPDAGGRDAYIRNRANDIWTTIRSVNGSDERMIYRINKAFQKSAKTLLELIDTAGYDEQSDRVFAQFEFDELRAAYELSIEHGQANINNPQKS